MQNRQSDFVSISRLMILVALFFASTGTAYANKFPNYLDPRYHSLFARFVDNRTIPERMLNSIKLTSKDYGRGFALIAGISKYPLMTGAGRDLAPAGEDVRKLVNYMTTYEKFDEIVVLKDGDMTEANLSFFLQKYFPRRLQEFPRSRFLFAYSGHGMTKDGRGYLLMPEARSLADDFNGIPMTTVRAMYQRIVDTGFHTLALINACYSGDFVRRSFGETRFIPRYPGAHVITAGGTGELTWHDGSIGTGSVFFEKFFAALDGRAGRDGLVTVDDLLAYLRREVRISTDQQQNPLPGDLSRDGSLGGFFFFDRRPLIETKDLPEWDSTKGLPFGARAGDVAAQEPTSTRPTQIAALLSEAFAQHKNGNYPQSIAGYSDIVRLDPANIMAFFGRAQSFARMGDYARASADYTEAIRLDPSNSAALVGRGNARFLSKDYDSALADYSAAIRISPNYSGAFALRGNLHRAQGRSDPAMADYSQAIKLDPTDASARYGRGSVHFDNRAYDRAIADYDEAIKLDPKFPHSFAARAAAYAAKGELDRAIADYSEAIKINGRDAAYYYWRGLAKQQKGDGAGGAADIVRAKELDSTIETRSGLSVITR